MAEAKTKRIDNQQYRTLTYGFYDKNELVGISMGHVRHWYSGTEYYIDEFCIKTSEQGKGFGSQFLEEIQKDLVKLGTTEIYLQTDKSTPAYEFYQKNGFIDLKDQVSFTKDIQ